MEKETGRKNKFWKGVLVGSLVTAFAVLILVGVATGILLVGRAMMSTQGQIEAQGVVDEPDMEKKHLDIERINRKLMTLEEMIDQEFLFEEDIDPEQMEAGIYKGMLAGLNDPYTVYYTPEEYEALTEETEGIYCGIGALVSQNIESGLITALRVFKNSPAEEAGMKKGDLIYKVGDIEASTMELDVLVQQEIRGEEGTAVDITVLRNGEELKLHIVRRVVEVTTVEAQMIDEETGYILVTQFDTVTADQFRDAVDELEEKGMKQLVIDLRDNPGGVLDAVVDMAAYVLPDNQFDGTIVSTSDKYGKGMRYFSKDGKIQYEANDGGGRDPRYPKDDGHELDVPIAVLINGNSASASEVFAGALRDYGSAKLVGTTSFGKGIVQTLVQLGDGSAVKMTISHYYTPSGFDLHKKGLDPDEEIALEVPEVYEGSYELPLDQDNQVQKALEVLGE